MAPLSFSRIIPAPPTPSQSNTPRQKSSEPFEISSDSDDQLEESSSEAEFKPKQKRKRREKNDQCDLCGKWFANATHHKSITHSKLVVVHSEDGSRSIKVYRDDDGKFGCLNKGCDNRNSTTLGYHVKTFQEVSVSLATCWD
ncbi:hypothetical protein NLI96_g12956 [Meripilus lineatus]|uniref:C2H2-type domain-containing protein n=1 Tax=Meripilus lineatus TaxID=2056292 RepID=A0AAD5UNV8_9APHY|nr:hypothetical protein NLI96_g12956 [Physisporinus lineatus]